MSAFTQLYSLKNLRLAWKRIRTGQNISYKKYYRRIFDAYNLALDDNLKHLSDSIRLSTYKPVECKRLMIPKPSGLQRPITLLSIEDQIVWQAIANIYSNKIGKRKAEVESRVACSNMLSKKKDNIFFLLPWKKSYSIFRRRVYQHFDDGHRYVADFDLSAFYDTISHDHIIKVFAPRGGNREFTDFVKKCLKRWTASNLSHGIPQGPIASDFMAECVMLEIDEKMQNSFKYVRYVDDIRILGRKEVEVHKGVVRLERYCRDLGLIPHSGKFGVRYANSKAEALGKMPSLRYVDYRERIENDKEIAHKLLLSALTKKRDRVQDSSRLKFILFRANASDAILGHVLRILPKYPDLIDVFAFYLYKFGRRTKIANRIVDLLKTGTPYEYVEGEYWQILSTSCYPRKLESIVPHAIDRHRQLGTDAMPIRLGIYGILSCSTSLDALRYLYRALFSEQNYIVKAYALSQIPYSFPDEKAFCNLLKQCLESNFVDPSVVAAWYICLFAIDWESLGVNYESVSCPAQNILNYLGVARKGVNKPDSIGILIHRRFRSPLWSKWKKLLKGDYKNAHRLVVMAEREFDESPSTWMGCIDSFNDLH